MCESNSFKTNPPIHFPDEPEKGIVMRKMILINIAVLVVAAVGIAWWCDCRVRSEVDRAIAQREKEDFNFWRQRLIPVYEQAGVKGNDNPTTKAELFEPLIRAMESVGTNATSSTSLAKLSPAAMPVRELTFEEIVKQTGLKCVNVENALLCDLIDNLREETEWSIYVEWPELNAIGISKESKVRVQMVFGTFEGLLRRIFENFSDAHAKANPIAYYVSDKVITITTQDRLIEHVKQQCQNIGMDAYNDVEID